MLISRMLHFIQHDRFFLFRLTQRSGATKVSVERKQRPVICYQLLQIPSFVPHPQLNENKEISRTPCDRFEMTKEGLVQSRILFPEITAVIAVKLTAGMNLFGGNLEVNING